MSNTKKITKAKCNPKLNFILLSILITILVIFLGITAYRFWLINLFCTRLNLINSNNFYMKKVVMNFDNDEENISEYIKYYCKDRTCKKEYINPQTQNIIRIEHEKLGEIYYDIDLINKTYMKRMDSINMSIDYPENVIQNEIKLILNLNDMSYKNKILLLLNNDFEIFIEDDNYVCIHVLKEENEYNILVNLNAKEIEFTQFINNEDYKNKTDCIQYLLYGLDKVTDEDITLYDLSEFELIEKINVINNDHYFQ